MYVLYKIFFFFWFFKNLPYGKRVFQFCVCVCAFFEARTKIRIMYYLSELERCKFLVNEIYIASHVYVMYINEAPPANIRQHTEICWVCVCVLVKKTPKQRQQICNIKIKRAEDDLFVWDVERCLQVWNYGLELRVLFTLRHSLCSILFCCYSFTGRFWSLAFLQSSVHLLIMHTHHINAYPKWICYTRRIFKW